MKYIYISILLASSLFARDYQPSAQADTSEQEILKAHLDELIKNIAIAQGMRKLVLVAKEISNSTISRTEKEDKIRLILSSPLKPALRKIIPDKRTQSLNRHYPFETIEGVDCKVSFYNITKRCSDFGCTETFHDRPLHVALNEFDACLAKHIASQEKDKRIIEQTLENV